jgi:hypothetical protein
VCDLKNLKNEEAMSGVGSQRHKKKSVVIWRMRDLMRRERQ